MFGQTYTLLWMNAFKNNLAHILILMRLDVAHDARRWKKDRSQKLTLSTLCLGERIQVLRDLLNTCMYSNNKSNITLNFPFT